MPVILGHSHTKKAASTATKVLLESTDAGSLQMELLAFFDNPDATSHIIDVFNGAWLERNASNWQSLSFGKRRAGMTSINITTKTEATKAAQISAANKEISRRLWREANLSLPGERRSRAQQLYKRYKEFVYKQQQQFLLELKKACADRLLRELDQLSIDQKIIDKIKLDLLYLATRSQEQGLEDNYSCLEMHKELNAFQKRITDLVAAQKIDSKSAQNIQKNAEAFSVVSKRYLDNAINNPVNPPKYHKLIDWVIFTLTAIAVTGIIASFAFGFPALAYLGILGSVVLAREVYILSRDLWYGRTPTNSALFKIGMGITLIAGGVVLPALMDVFGFVQNIVHLAKEIGHLVILGAKSLALVAHSATFFNAIAGLGVGIAAFFGARQLVKSPAKPVTSMENTAQITPNNMKQEMRAAKNPPAKKTAGEFIFRDKSGVLHETDSVSQNIGKTHLHWYVLKGKETSTLRENLQRINFDLGEYQAKLNYFSQNTMRKGDIKMLQRMLDRLSSELNTLFTKEKMLDANPRLAKQASNLKDLVADESANLAKLSQSVELTDSIAYEERFSTRTRGRIDI